MKRLLCIHLLLLLIGLAGCTAPDASVRPGPDETSSEPAERLEEMQMEASDAGVTSRAAKNPSHPAADEEEEEITFDPPAFTVERIYFTRQNGTLYYYSTKDYVNHKLLDNASEHGFIASDRLLVIVDGHRLISTSYDGREQRCIYATAHSISNLYTDRRGAFSPLDNRTVVRLDLQTKEIDSYKVDGPPIQFIVPISNFRVRVHPYSDLYLENPPPADAPVLGSDYYRKPFAIDFRENKG